MDIGDVRDSLADSLELEELAGFPPSDFIQQVADEFQGTSEEFEEYVRANIKKWFRCIDQTPRWIQAADWLYHEGRPMVFVGQIDIKGKAGIRWFHDDTTFYLFWDTKTGVTKTVTQQY